MFPSSLSAELKHKSILRNVSHFHSDTSLQGRGQGCGDQLPSPTPTQVRGGGSQEGVNRIEDCLRNIPGAPSFQVDIIFHLSPNSTRMLASRVTSAVDCFHLSALQAGVCPHLTPQRFQQASFCSSLLCTMSSPVLSTQWTLTKHTWGRGGLKGGRDPAPVLFAQVVESPRVLLSGILQVVVLKNGISSARKVWRRWH